MADYSAPWHSAGFGASDSRARITQIMNLLYLAPDIQEQLLLLPRIEKGNDRPLERDLRPIATVLDWRKQRQMWKRSPSPSAASPPR